MLLPLISHVKLPLKSTSTAVRIPVAFRLPSSQTFPELVPDNVGGSFIPVTVMVIVLESDANKSSYTLTVNLSSYVGSFFKAL